MYFNPYASATLDDGSTVDIKYGVISLKYLEDDLANWTTLYCGPAACTSQHLCSINLTRLKNCGAEIFMRLYVQLSPCFLAILQTSNFLRQSRA